MSSYSELKARAQYSERIGYASWVSRENKFLYIENPKVACSKIKECLQVIAGYQVPNPRWKIHLRESPSEYVSSLEDLRDDEATYCLNANEIFRFTFVRNPYSRIWSAYKSKIQSSDPQFHGIREIIRNKYQELYIKDKDIKFFDFCRFVCGQEDSYRDAHWKLQTNILYSDYIDYTYIGRLEYFAHDFSFVLKKLNAPLGMRAEAAKKVNQTKSIGSPFNFELAKMVYDAYKGDFEYFGYEEDSWQCIV
jgi:hypothetical protein